ncbi:MULTISPECIES: hypothetical protein [unclassified Breznakia]|uniref:hypothetical protein n=1 Tax=unclassified Breznakia TaxID=2623764 RepID=UPI002474CAE1|nr:MULTISPECIES: hypothetical protein [unclassified Breznakia]MDH6367615.1 hypothetical protein [Breznakia sp. PH1-1]MDH6403965.1 hypothetical protein [Breznakia sp. PF1-11]MDH6411674.1 hypothetical protein [Breznakia sp. PFB1-11]MDH6414744.1 hypothetical protein [Breznakia sp. PFB1-14]MDH6416025.1 hypothetical protein [Breznakia sp. PFB1-4]
MKYINKIGKCIIVTVLLLGMFIVQGNTKVLAKDSTPTISVNGITLHSDTPTSMLENLVNLENVKDFNFYMNEQLMSEGNAYFAYAYDQEETFNGVTFTGWWGDQQGINKYKVQYKVQDQWVDLEETTVTYANGNAGGPTTLTKYFNQPITTTDIRVVVLGVNTVWSKKTCMHVIAPKIDDSASSSMTKPVVSFENLTLQKGEMDYFVSNPDAKDIDFSPGGDLTSKNAYIVYDYTNLVEIDRVEMIGWYPTSQGIKNADFEYFEDGEWKSLEKNVTFAWKTKAGVQAQENLVYTLKKPVQTTKFRIKVNAGYTQWGSSKINMRLVKPNGKLVRKIGELNTIADTMEKNLRRLLIGDTYGEFSTTSVQTLLAALEHAKSIAANPDVNEIEYEAELVKLKDEIQTFYTSQNALSGKVQIQAENLTIKEGKLENLIDGQLGTGVAFEEFGSALDGSIILTFEKEISAKELLILTDKPKTHGVSTFTVSAKQNDQWVPITSDVVIPWLNTIHEVEGHTYDLTSQGSVLSNTFKVDLKGSATEQQATKLQLLLIKGESVVDSSSLEATISKAKTVLDEQTKATGLKADPEVIELLEMHILIAENSDVLARSTQVKVNQMEADLQTILALIEEQTKPVIHTEKLVEAITKAEAIDATLYTSASYAKVTDAIDKANKVLVNPKSQEAVDAATTMLETAMNGLVKLGDKADLQVLVDIVDVLEASEYTEETWNVVADTLAKAKVVLANDQALQADVDTVYDALLDAVSKLTSTVEVAKDELQDLVEDSSKLKEADYTKDTWNVFVDALEKAKTVLEDPNATAGDVLQAKVELTNAINQLKEPSKELPSVTPETPDKPVNGTNTGDTTNVNLLLMLLALSALGIGFGYKKKLKK